jgi:hypothetical protein
VAEEEGDSITLSGLIESEMERRTALEIAAALAGGKRIIDNLEIASVLPEEIGEMSLSEASAGDFTAATTATSDTEALEPGDFSDQRIGQDPFTADGPSGTAVDEEVSEGDESYVPPIDPVRDSSGEFIGGFAVSATDDLEVEPSASDDRLGDEAIAEAVRRELHEDAATTDLEIQVEVRNGVVRLRGSVRDVMDAEAAEEVAGRLPGVLEVREELRVANV